MSETYPTFWAMVRSWLLIKIICLAVMLSLGLGVLDFFNIWSIWFCIPIGMVCGVASSMIADKVVKRFEAAGDAEVKG